MREWNIQKKAHQRGLMCEEAVQRNARTSAMIVRLQVRVSRDYAIAWMLLLGIGLMK